MATHKPFRELIKPGTNFEFMGRAKFFGGISLLLVIASIAMLFVNKSAIPDRGEYLNWSTDFKGGTEIILGFHEKGSDQPAQVERDE
jgi:preprotein translocase subunit SecF